MRSHAATAVLVCACAAATGSASGAAQATTPAPLTRVDGVTPMTDAVAVRTDGLAVAQVGDALRLVDVQGGTYPFAVATLRSLDGRGHSARMVALAPVRAGAQTCAFRPNDLVVGVPSSGGGSEDLRALDAQGGLAPWRSSIPDGTALAATFDATGRFGLSLLVLVRRDDGAAVEQFDCQGRRVEVAAGIASAQPGIAVLPAEAGGPAGGAAVVATGAGMVRITPDGTVAPLPVQGWSATVRVQGLAAVPAGFTRGTGLVDVPGEHGLLQAHAADLAAAGLHDGDLLAAAGSPAELIAVHCSDGACSALTVARSDASGGAATGRPAVLPTQVGGDVVLPRDSQGAGWTLGGVAAAAALALGVPGLVRVRRRRAAVRELEERLLHDDPGDGGDQR